MMEYVHGETEEQSNRRRELQQKLYSALSCTAEEGETNYGEGYTDALSDAAYAITHGMIKGVTLK
jgi:hypothetical protein